MTDRPRAAIYARFSTDLQNERSAEDQVRVCRDRADREGWDVVNVYSDLAISGTKANRPGLLAMLAAADAREFDLLVVEDLDRVSRNQADGALIFQRLEFAGIRIFSLMDGAISELHIGLKGTMNALQLKQTAAKIRRGQVGVVSRGGVPGGLCYGYDVDPVLNADGSVERGRRKINPAQAEVVRRIYSLFLAGVSPREIAHRLNSEGVPSPRGGEWRCSSIVGSRARQIGILHNPIYAGRLVYNRVTMVQHFETRKRLSRVNPPSEWKIADHPELRIVDQESWEAVQAWREARNHLPFQLQARPRHLLSGLIRCKRCGGSYAVLSADRLGCTRHREAGTCDNRRRISVSRLEERVFAGLTEKLLAPDVVSAVVRRYHAERERLAKERRLRRRAEETRLAAIEEETKRLVDALACGDADFPEIREALSSRRTEAAAIRAAIGEDEAHSAIILHPRLADQYRARVRALGAALTKGDKGRSEALPKIRGLIDAILIGDAPGEPDNASIEVLGSLAQALALASGVPIKPAATARPTVQVVAEEGLEPPTRGL
jgi:site-specific DNA recombinase